MPKPEPEKAGVLKYHVVRAKVDGRTHYFHVAIVPKPGARRTKETSRGADR
jgi:hypothetical protein